MSSSNNQSNKSGKHGKKQGEKQEEKQEEKQGKKITSKLSLSRAKKKNPDLNLNQSNQTADPYLKLEEASRIYLNPTLTQIKAGVDLSQCCYFRLKKYPKGTSEFWSLLRDREFDQLEIFVVEELKDQLLLSNLQLAQRSLDADYLIFLENKQPTSKLKLNVTPKQQIVDSELLQALHLDDEWVTLDHLKMAMHAYIAEHDLQEKRSVVIDQVLIKLLSLQQLGDDEQYSPGLPVSYWDLWKAFKLKFLN